jgi:pyrroline-5-carboxylate reductase
MTPVLAFLGCGSMNGSLLRGVLASGVPVIHLIRTAFNAEGRAVEVCDTVMAADAYVLSYQLPAT